MTLFNAHRELLTNMAEYEKYRYTLRGGRDYVNRYLLALSDKEEAAALQLRRDKMYCPNHATAAVGEIGDSLHQRLVDVIRIGGSRNYQNSVLSDVDGLGKSMSLYMGMEIIDELLPMGKVGVLVDAPVEIGRNTVQPYLTAYGAEAIYDWFPYRPTQRGYDYIVLKETLEGTVDGVTSYETTFRRYDLTENGTVTVTFGKEDGTITSVIDTKLTKIPFHVFQIATPLLRDIADIQIALMNQEASELNYIAQANYPIYYEFYDKITDGTGIKTSASQTDGTKEVTVGLTRCRRIPKGLEAPGFVAPPPSSLQLSLQKSKDLKDDIRRLLRLNLNTVANTSRLSADSRKMDMSTLESQLAAIGQVLCDGENVIASFWAMFEGSKETASVTYPSVYEIKPDDQRIEEATNLLKFAEKIPSITAKRSMLGMAVDKLFRGKISEAQIEKIKAEISSNALPILSTSDLVMLYKEGMVTDKVVERAFYLPAGTTSDGQKEKAERLKATLEAQGGTPGMNSPNNGRPPGGNDVRESE